MSLRDSVACLFLIFSLSGCNPALQKEPADPMLKHHILIVGAHSGLHADYHHYIQLSKSTTMF